MSERLTTDEELKAWAADKLVPCTWPQMMSMARELLAYRQHGTPEQVGQLREKANARLCGSCFERHDIDVMCPPHECRTTGQQWFRERLAELERERDQARKAVSFGKDPESFDWAVLGRIDELEEQLDTARRAAYDEAIDLMGTFNVSQSANAMYQEYSRIYEEMRTRRKELLAEINRRRAKEELCDTQS